MGEIIDGKLVPRTADTPVKTIDIKDYGEVVLCHKHADGLLEKLEKVWGLDDAKRIYTMAVLRATELTNFLSVFITTRVKNDFVKKGISKKCSYKQVFKYLSTTKRQGWKRQ